MSNISDGYANSYKSEKRVWKSVKNGYTHFTEGDVGIAKITPCFENRKSVVFHKLINQYGAGTTELHIIRCFKDYLIPEFVLLLAKRNSFITGGVQTFAGDVGQQRVTKEYISNYLFPFPPYSEQKEIVNIVKVAFGFIDQIELSENELNEIIELMKSKILDLAIRGKLVPQNPDDEPASVLLERIRAEKEELIKQGKIKRDKNESIIFKGEDNSYYEDLPKLWTICSLGEISVLERGITFPSSAKENLSTKYNIACARTANVQEKFDTSDLIYIDKSYMKNNSAKLLMQGDIIVSTANSFELVGKSCFVEELEQEMTFGGFVTVVRGIKLNRKYLYLCLHHKYLNGEYSFKSTQTTNIANISSSDLLNTILYLPPLAEQERIVKAVEAAFEVINRIYHYN